MVVAEPSSTIMMPKSLEDSHAMQSSSSPTDVTNHALLLAIGATCDDPKTLPEQKQGMRKTTTVVLCDPRNLTHLVPKKMPERSLRIVKIMAKLSSLQASLVLNDAAAAAKAEAAAAAIKEEPVLASKEPDCPVHINTSSSSSNVDGGEAVVMDIGWVGNSSDGSGSGSDGAPLNRTLSAEKSTALLPLGSQHIDDSMVPENATAMVTDTDNATSTISATETTDAVGAVPAIVAMDLEVDNKAINGEAPLPVQTDPQLLNRVDNEEEVGDESEAEEYLTTAGVSTPFAASKRRLGHLDIRCLARDETIDLQDCFWEAMSLVHADEYIEYLRARARASARLNPPFIPMKDHAVQMEPEEEILFNTDMSEEIPVDDNDIRAAAEECGESLPAAMLRRNARTLSTKTSTGTSSALSSFSAGVVNAGSTVRRISNTTIPPLGEDERVRYGGAHNRLGLPKNVAEVLLTFREESLSPNFAPDDSDRVWMWDSTRGRRVGGHAAPFFKNLRESLERNTHLLIYTGQDSKGETPPIQWDIVQWLRRAVDPSNTDPLHSTRRDAKDRATASSSAGDASSSNRHRLSSMDSHGSGMMRANKSAGRMGPGLGSASILAGLGRKPSTATSATLRRVFPPLPEGETKRPLSLAGYSQFRRISVWNTVRKVRVSGGNAPMKKDLKAFLDEKKEYVIWTGQRADDEPEQEDKGRLQSQLKADKLLKKLPKDSQRSRFNSLTRDALHAAVKIVDRTSPNIGGVKSEQGQPKRINKPRPSEEFTSEGKSGDMLL